MLLNNSMAPVVANMDISNSKTRHYSTKRQFVLRFETAVLGRGARSGIHDSLLYDGLSIYYSRLVVDDIWDTTVASSAASHKV